MSILATDAFTGTGALSASWTVDQGLSARLSDQCTLTDNVGSGQVSVRYTGVTTPNDHYAKATIGSVVDTVTDTGAGPMVRAQDASNFYTLQGNTVETKIYKKVAGAFTQLGSNGPSVTTGDILYLEIQGTQLIAKKNGTTICGSPTDNALSTGRGGLWGSPDATSVVLHLDDFEVGDFSGGGGSRPVKMAGVWNGFAGEGGGFAG